MPFAKLESDGLRKTFVRQIQKMIFSGELKPGERLPPERELASRMGISRSLINAGIMELETQGFVHIIPRKGTIVTDYQAEGTPAILAALMTYDSSRVDFSMFDSLMDTRVLVECEACRLAASRVSGADIAELRKLTAQIGSVRDSKDAVAPMIRLHYCILRYSGNVIFAMSFKGFEQVLISFTTKHFTIEPDLSPVVNAYNTLIDRLEAHDAVGSSAQMRICLGIGIEKLRNLYKQV